MTQTVDKANTAGSAISVGASTHGELITITGTVAVNSPGGGIPTGTLTFMDGSSLLGTATLRNGQATLDTSVNGVAAHPLCVLYGGDANYVGTTSPATTHVVSKAETAAVVAVSAGHGGSK